MPLAVTTPAAAAEMAVPWAATMSTPRCHARHLHPNVELTAPSTGQANWGAPTETSGIARMRFSGGTANTSRAGDGRSAARLARGAPRAGRALIPFCRLLLELEIVDRFAGSCRDRGPES